MLVKILGIWAAATIPYFILAWVVGDDRSYLDFLYALPVKNFRTTWFSIIIHSSINVVWTIMFIGLISGMAG